MCVHLCSKLMVYLKKDINQEQCLYISKYICVLGETVPWKDVTSNLPYGLDDIDCHTELLDEPCEQMLGIIEVLLSLYNHVLKYEDSSTEKCSESLRNLGICLTTVCEAILNEVVFLSFVIKLKYVIAFLMQNFCNRGDEVLEHRFICCWMKITHSIERHWGHINSESLTAAVITMLKAVAEHGSLEILRYTLKFWIGLPPKCSDLTPNLKLEIENMFAEMESSLQRKEEKLKCNKNKIGPNKKRVSFAEKSFVTTYSPESVDPAHLNELSEKISSVKIQENTNVTVHNENTETDGEDSSSLLSLNSHRPTEGVGVVNETPTVPDTVSQNAVCADDTTDSVHVNPFAKSFFSTRTRRSSMATVADTDIDVCKKNVDPQCVKDEIRVCKKDNKIKLSDDSKRDTEGKNVDGTSSVMVQERNYETLTKEASSESELEIENDCQNHENINHVETESDNSSDIQCVRESIQHNKSRLSLRKGHEILENKQCKSFVIPLKPDNQLESNTSMPRTDSGLSMKTEKDTEKRLSVNSVDNQNRDVKNRNSKVDSHSENSANNLIADNAEAKPLSLFGQMCDRNVTNQQIASCVESRPAKELPARTLPESEDANLEMISDQNSQFAKPEEKCVVRRRKSLQATDFPVRHSPRRPLTKHQKECLKRKRDDIPALYCDLSEDSQSSSYSEMSQDDSQISIPERRSLSKPARSEEKQLSFAHLRRVSKPNSLSSLIQKTLEAPEKGAKNETNKGKPSSDAVSPETKIRKIDTTNTEQIKPAGHEQKCQEKHTSGPALSSEDGSVLTSKDSMDFIAEKEFEGVAVGNSIGLIKSSEIKGKTVDSNNSVKDDKENSSSINGVSAPAAGSEPLSPSSITTMSENSPNRRKSLRPLKRIIRNVGKNSGNNKVGPIHKWRTQNRRESLHPLKRLTNKGKNSKSFKLGLLKDKKNLSPGCTTVKQNTIDVSENVGLPYSKVSEASSTPEKNQFNCKTSEAAGADSFKPTTPSPLKDLTQSKIDKYTLRSRLSSDGNVHQPKKSVQHEPQMKRDGSTGLPSSVLENIEVSVEIKERDVQDAENEMRKSKGIEKVKSDSNSKLEQFNDVRKTTLNSEDELQLASTGKETAGKQTFGSVLIGQQGDSNTEKSKSMKLRDRSQKSLSTKNEASAKDLCGVLSETAKHNNLNANDKSTVSEEQNTGGLKTRKVKQRNIPEVGKTVVECDNFVGKALRKEKHLTEMGVIETSDSSLSKENINKCTSVQRENEPCEESHALKTVTDPNDECRIETDASIINRDVSDSFPQGDEITKIFRSGTIQVVSPSGKEHEIKFIRDEKKAAGCGVDKASGHLAESVDVQQLNNLKLVPEPYVQLTNIIAKQDVASSLNEHPKCTIGSEQRKSLQLSSMDSEDFVEDSQDLTLSSNKRTRKLTRRVSDGRNTRSSLEPRSQQLIASGSNKTDTPQLVKLTSIKVNKEKESPSLVPLQSTSDDCSNTVTETTDSGLFSESSVKQNKPIDSYESSESCVVHSNAPIPFVPEVDDVNKEIKTLYTPGTTNSDMQSSSNLSIQDGHSMDSCKDTVKSEGPKETEQVVNTIDKTSVPNVVRDKLHISLSMQSVNTLTMRRSLRARRKSKTHGCLYSSCCRQVDTNKTRIAKRITAKSLRLARQGQLQKVESPVDRSSLLPTMNSKLHGESNLQTAKQKTECAVHTESALRPIRATTYSKDGTEIEPPETNTKADSGCLKRKSVSDEEIQKDDVSPKKQKKRVSFSDPDVSSTCYFEEYPIEELHKDYQWIARSGGTEDKMSEDQLVLDMEDLRDYSEDFEEDTSLLDSQSPIWPSLADCTFPVEEVVKFMVAPTWAKNAVRYFEEQGIRTIGDISSMDEARISALPVREPKVAVVKKVLKAYEEKVNRIIAGATAAEVNSSRTRRKIQRPQRRVGVTAVIQKSSKKSIVDQLKTSKESKTSAGNSEDLQNNSSEVVFKPFDISTHDNDGSLQHDSEEHDIVNEQKILPGSSHSALVEKKDKSKVSRQSANYTKDGTCLPGVSKSNNEVSSPSSAGDESIKKLPPSNQSTEKKIKNDNTDLKDSRVNQVEAKNIKQQHQKHIQEELVVVANDSSTLRNTVTRAVGRTEQMKEKVVAVDSLVVAKETNENSTYWQDDVLSQKEFDSILGDWNMAMSDEILESRCMEILENGNCKEDSDVQSNNEVTVSTKLPQATTDAVLASHAASGSGNKKVTDHHTFSHNEKPKDNVDCCIPELKTAIEKHSIADVTRELLRLWKYGEGLRQDISVGNLLTKLERAEATDLKKQTQSVAVQANSCFCDPQTINALKMIYEKICCTGESKT